MKNHSLFAPGHLVTVQTACLLSVMDYDKFDKDLQGLENMPAACILRFF